jgi:hypothetical protein
MDFTASSAGLAVSNDLIRIMSHILSKSRVCIANNLLTKKWGLLILHRRCAHVAQSAEHLHGKQKVTSSILVVGSYVS